MRACGHKSNVLLSACRNHVGLRLGFRGTQRSSFDNCVTIITRQVIRQEVSSEVLYKSNSVRRQCTDLLEASKHVGGDKKTARAILSRINALEQALFLKDIVMQPPFRFHKLDDKHKRKLDGFFAIDVKGSRCPWRIVLQPLDDEGKPFDPCHIDEIAGTVSSVCILEVSKHYE